jgi:CelD/BcsL family acetyltransferase involved in cellulose biosynthesis
MLDTKGLCSIMMMYHQMNLEVMEIRSLDELMELAPRWLELLPNSGEDDLFLRPEWMASWWKIWGDQHRMCSIIVLRGEEVVGIAPLMLSTRGRVKRWTKLQFMATGPTDHLGFIVKNQDPEVLDAIWRHVHGMRCWDMLELRELWETAPTFISFKKFFKEFESVKGTSLYVDLSVGREDYYNSVPGIQKHLKRYWKKLKTDLNVDYREYDATEDLRPRLEELRRINMKRWEGEGSSPFMEPRMRRFLEMVVGEHASSLGITFKGLYSGDKVIALNLGYEYGRRYLYYIPGYNSEFASYSPGSVLRAMILEECLNRDFIELDFLRGTEKHKFQYNAKDRRLISVRIIRPGIVRSVEARLREGDFL